MHMSRDPHSAFMLTWQELHPLRDLPGPTPALKNSEHPLYASFLGLSPAKRQASSTGSFAGFPGSALLGVWL